jgi:hypothetical protein
MMTTAIFEQIRFKAIGANNADFFVFNDKKKPHEHYSNVEIQHF